MTLTRFRQLLAERLENESESQATDNGRASSRDLGEYRYNAGVAKGLLMAAMVTHDFLKDDEGEVDG